MTAKRLSARWSICGAAEGCRNRRAKTAAVAGPRRRNSQDVTQNPSRTNGNDSAADTSNQDGSAGNDNAATARPKDSQPEMVDGDAKPMDQRDPTGDQDSAGSKKPADQPGKTAQDAAGDGQNTQPQAGPGEQATAPKTPKDTAGAEKTDNQATPAVEKQSGHGDEGEAGSGKPSDSSEAAPESQQVNRDRDKDSRNTGQETPDNSNVEPTSPAVSEKQSDSPGDVGGDKSGGGERGGGQSADQPGRDSPGSNMSSDQGNTGSHEPGKGETADRAGDAQQSPGTTGQSGQDPGQGSQSRAAPEGQTQTPDGAVPRNPQAQPDGKESQSPQQPDALNRDISEGGMSSGPPQGGGLPGDSTIAPDSRPGESRTETRPIWSMREKRPTWCCERLKDQQDEPDPELLKSLGWTKEELQQFIARWESSEAGGTRREWQSRRRTGRCPAQPGTAFHHPRQRKSQGRQMISSAACTIAVTGVDHPPSFWNNSMPTKGCGTWATRWRSMKPVNNELHRYLVPFPPKQIPHFFTDVLIIGAGLAGFASRLAVDPEVVGARVDQGSGRGVGQQLCARGHRRRARSRGLFRLARRRHARRRRRPVRSRGGVDGGAGSTGAHS